MMSRSQMRELVSRALSNARDAALRAAPPLGEPPAIPKMSLLDALARASASKAERERSFRAMARHMPARYDAYDWWADDMPNRQKIRDSVLGELRRRGMTGVPPKVIDKITSAIIDRVRRRGLKPKDHRTGGSWYCDCPHCQKQFALMSKAMFGVVLQQ